MTSRHDSKDIDGPIVGLLRDGDTDSDARGVSMDAGACPEDDVVRVSNASMDVAFEPEALAHAGFA